MTLAASGRPSDLPEHESIDAQRELTLELVDSLEGAVRRGADPKCQEELLLELIDYTSEHFFAEQDLMRAAGYSGYEAHVEQHNQLLQKVAGLQEQLSSGSRGLSVATLLDLRPCLVGHVEGPDRILADFLRRRVLPSASLSPRQRERML